MKDYYITSWPSKSLHISVEKVDRTTGTVLKTKATRHKRSRTWWIARGFSFNGRLSARAGITNGKRATR